MKWSRTDSTCPGAAAWIASCVRLVVRSRHQAALLHPGDLVGKPARGPEHERRELGEAQSLSLRLGDVGQDVVVGLGEPAGAREVTAELQVEQRSQSPIRPPGSGLGLVEPPRFGHLPDSTGFSLTCHLYLCYRSALDISTI
jgi:hypothetical protein